ncbi:response regulator transcription factor [Sulfurimonas sp. SAG-AH-194-I05]|nr:LuxR C-terminal-related transcriptional regulator [Sulfurimonas sp. SAG-AH-194-I05]MDF1874824.1 response regulator transcription factor [Sulfurimonas sp. SAG-AH-194-I05]
MEIIFFSTNSDMISEWNSMHSIEFSLVCSDIESLQETIKKHDTYAIIIDYDSVSSEFNKLISAGDTIKNIIVLEKSPEIATGKMLLSHAVKAYGNSKMRSSHFYQMIETVMYGKVWTYPELTIALVKSTKHADLNEDSLQLIKNRLTRQEVRVVKHILNGLTNQAISTKLGITLRTAKAHVSSIFQKLHVTDRISLVLLLK